MQILGYGIRARSGITGSYNNDFTKKCNCSSVRPKDEGKISKGEAVGNT
ncbi:MAG: hypothetical protein IPQ27_04795 [Chitinophagaceae bacterium]|nr:hypothetical protein [Chitinophagaceae bacterium]